MQKFIIGLAFVTLTACSMVRMGYTNGPALALWWLDGYLDLDDAQEAEARPLVQEWFVWHRSTQLPQYTRWLNVWRERAGGEVSADEVCRWTAQVRDAMWTATEQALPAGARLLPTLKPSQLAHLASEMADKLADERRERAPPSAEARRAAALERAIDRAEQLYGSVTDAQQRLLAEGLARSPMDAARWLDDREQRQRRFVDELRAAGSIADAGARLVALRRAANTLTQPADAQSAALQARWQAHGCEMSAQLHASTSPAQRQHLRERLSAWDEDLRALARPGAF